MERAKAGCTTKGQVTDYHGAMRDKHKVEYCRLAWLLSLNVECVGAETERNQLVQTVIAGMTN